MDKPGIKLSPHECYVFSPVYKPSIDETWAFKSNMTPIKNNTDQSPKQ